MGHRQHRWGFPQQQDHVLAGGGDALELTAASRTPETGVGGHVQDLPLERIMLAVGDRTARRRAIAAVRDAILENLPEGFEEGMEFGMIGYYIPLERYPETYNGHPLGIAALANQKNHMALYLMGMTSRSMWSVRRSPAHRSTTTHVLRRQPPHQVTARH